MNIKNRISICSLAILCFLFLLNSSCGKNDDDNPTSSEYTTLTRTIVPDYVTVVPTVRIDNPADFSKYGYGKWHYEPGLPAEKRLDLMPKGYLRVASSFFQIAHNFFFLQKKSLAYRTSELVYQ